MRANQTCSEWARLSGNKLRHYERPLMSFSHRDIFGFTPDQHIMIGAYTLITDRFFF